MRRILQLLRLLAGLALLPACWGCARAFADTLAMIPFSGAGGFFAAFAALAAGMLAFAALWIFAPRPVRAYVLGHELTHAFWGLMFGARASDLRVGAAGGSVKLSKSNIVITLSPYFFPFYTMLVVLAALVTRLFVNPLPLLGAWLFAVGFTWCFHCCFTVQSLLQRQPDVEEYGRVFSWSFILLMNLAGMLLWTVCTTSVPFADAGRALGSRTASAYRAVWSLATQKARLAWRAFQ